MGIRAIEALTAFLSVILLLSVSPADASGNTLRVTNDGVDSGSCGAPTKPCRSISQALENATDGDTIEVGTGFYGDVSGTGTFTGPGDEHPQTLPNLDNCMICITKAVRIFSLHGADATIIKAPAATFDANVEINHDAVMFGSKDHGFTMSGGNRAGVLISLLTNTAGNPINVVSGIRVSGNIDIADAVGFEYQGSREAGHPCEGGCVYTGLVLWSDNEAVNNGTGFDFQQGQVDVEPVLIQHNIARGGGIGFQVYPGPVSLDSTGRNTVQNIQIIDNVATGGTAFGFDLNSVGEVRGNTASGNAQGGFLIVPGGPAFRGNSSIGNGGPGVIVNFSKDGNSPGAGAVPPYPTFHAFNHNNIYGNDRNRPDLQLRPLADGGGTPFDLGPSAHCGVVNVGELYTQVDIFGGPGRLGPPVLLPVADNFWGSSQGPSPTGPGDRVGGPCDENNGTTTAKPFATAPF